MTTSTYERNEAALAQAVERWNAGDLDGYLTFYDDSIRWHGNGPQPMGKAAVRAFYEGILAAFSENRLDVHETFGVDDRLTCRYTLSGKHAGTFLGVPATGTQVAIPGITIMHFREGRCVERWSSADMLGALVQVGAIPPPA
jgi:steroid delta-isomerase-like uncharacterized protein